MIEHVKRLCEI